jgi:hypothetical protein
MVLRLFVGRPEDPVLARRPVGQMAALLLAQQWRRQGEQAVNDD